MAAIDISEVGGAPCTHHAASQQVEHLKLDTGAYRQRHAVADVEPARGQWIGRDQRGGRDAGQVDDAKVLGHGREVARRVQHRSQRRRGNILGRIDRLIGVVDRVIAGGIDVDRAVDDGRTCRTLGQLLIGGGIGEAATVAGKAFNRGVVDKRDGIGSLEATAVGLFDGYRAAGAGVPRIAGRGQCHKPVNGYVRARCDVRRLGVVDH